MHLNPLITPEQGTLQYLMHEGIVVDVAGARRWQLDPDGIDRVVERHPRHRFVVDAGTGLRAHGRRVRGCRAGALFATGSGPMLEAGGWPAAERAVAVG